MSTGKPLLRLAWQVLHDTIHFQHELAIVQQFQSALDLNSSSSVMAALGGADASNPPTCGVMPRLSSHYNREVLLPCNDADMGHEFHLWHLKFTRDHVQCLITTNRKYHMMYR